MWNKQAQHTRLVCRRIFGHLTEVEQAGLTAAITWLHLNENHLIWPLISHLLVKQNMLFNVQDLLLFSFMATNDNFVSFRLLKKNVYGLHFIQWMINNLQICGERKYSLTALRAFKCRYVFFPHSDALSAGQVFFDKPTSALSSVHSMQTFKWNRGMNVFSIGQKILV